MDACKYCQLLGVILLFTEGHAQLSYYSIINEAEKIDLKFHCELKSNISTWLDSEGNPAVVNCEPTSTHPHIQVDLCDWTNQSITVKNASMEDEGMWTCAETGNIQRIPVEVPDLPELSLTENNDAVSCKSETCFYPSGSVTLWLNGIVIGSYQATACTTNGTYEVMVTVAKSDIEYGTIEFWLELDGVQGKIVRKIDFMEMTGDTSEGNSSPGPNMISSAGVLGTFLGWLLLFNGCTLMHQLLPI